MGGTGRKEKAHVVVVVGISIINELFQLVCLLACLVDYYRNMLCVYEGGSDYNWEQQQQCLFASGATGIKLVILLLWKRVTEATRRLNWNWKYGEVTILLNGVGRMD